MNEELFNRLKKLSAKEGKVVFVEGNSAFVLLPLEEYEMLTNDLCGEECGEDCSCGEEHNNHDFDFGEEVFTNNGDNKKPEDEDDKKADKELIKRVNEDIAKWREEQASHESMKTLKHENIKAEDEEIKDVAKTEAKNDVLTEEERYYLEPLE